MGEMVLHGGLQLKLPFLFDAVHLFYFSKGTPHFVLNTFIWGLS